MPNQKPIRIIRVNRSFSDWLIRLWQRRETLWFFIWKDLKVQYEKPIFGLLWSVFQPLVYFAVILGVIHFSGRSVSETEMPFELYLLCGLAIWNFFTSSILGAMNSMQSNAGLISKASFPRLYLILSPLIKSVFDLAVMLLIVLVAAVFSDATISMLPIAVLLSLLIALPTALGSACISTSLIVWNRHFRHAIPILLYALIFALPVFYSMEGINNKEVQLLYKFNPVAGAMDVLRSGLTSTDLQLEQLMFWVTSSTFILMAGVLTFRKTEKTLADQV